MRVSRFVRGFAVAASMVVAAQVVTPTSSVAESETTAPSTATLPSTQQLDLARSIAAARDLNAVAGQQAVHTAVGFAGARNATTTEKLVSVPGVGAASVDPKGACMQGPGARDCNKAIAFMVAQMKSGALWHSRCLALVSSAYGDAFADIPRAVDAALQVKAAGRMLTTKDYKQIPRGAVLWWQSVPGQGSAAGHVAISIGGGMAISSDAPDDNGHVGIVPIEFFEKTWHKVFLGYSLA